MIRTILPVLLAICVMLTLSACVNDPPTGEQPSTSVSTATTTAVTAETTTTVTPSSTNVIKTITPEQAKTIALQHAKLASATVRRVDAERDLERGVLVYEVEFDHNGYEYSYDIHAETGEILRHEKEIDH